MCSCYHNVIIDTFVINQSQKHSRRKKHLQNSNIPSLIPGCRKDCHPPTRYFHTQSPCYLCWSVMQCTSPLHRTIQPRQNIENTKRSTKIKVFANCSACSIALESAVSKNYSSLLYRTFYAYFSKNSIIGYFRKILVKIQAKMLGTSFVFTLATCKKISDNSSVPSSVLYGQFGPLRTIRSSRISPSF